MHPVPYSFRAVLQTDLPLLQAWLKTPAVRRWWGDPEEELASIKADIDDPRMSLRLVLFNDEPFAYTQDYEVHAWPQPHVAHLPIGTRGIDTLIGVPYMLGKGHGSGYIKALAQMLMAEGAAGLVIDPDTENRVARAAYKKAGFTGDDEIVTEQGVIVLMYYQGTQNT